MAARLPYGNDPFGLGLDQPIDPAQPPDPAVVAQGASAYTIPHGGSASIPPTALPLDPSQIATNEGVSAASTTTTDPPPALTPPSVTPPPSAGKPPVYNGDLNQYMKDLAAYSAAGGTGTTGATTTTTTAPGFIPNDATKAAQVGTPKGGIDGVPNFTDPTAANGLQLLSSALASYPSNPQQAIDIFNANPNHGGLGAKWYPDSQTIGLDNGTYLVAPGAGGNPSKTNWQTVVRGPEGDTTHGGTTIDPNSGLSTDIEDAIRKMLQNGGSTGSPLSTALNKQLIDLLNNGGGLNTDRLNQRLSAARSAEATANAAQINDARDALAANGTLSEPGTPQGALSTAVDRITRAIAPQYASTVSGIYTDESQQADARLTSAISAATGLDENQASNILSAVGTGTQRQVALAQIALNSLANNQQWNEFLATYGLNRDQVMAEIQNGNLSSIATLLQIFMQGAGTSAGGFI